MISLKCWSIAVGENYIWATKSWEAVKNPKEQISYLETKIAVIYMYVTIMCIAKRVEESLEIDHLHRYKLFLLH